MRFESFISDLKNTSKPKEKQDVLKRYESGLLSYLITATYDPFKLYHVNIKKGDIPAPGPADLSETETELLDLLSFCAGSNSNKQNRERVVELLSLLNEGSQELLIGTLNKNWKAGLGVRNILKVYPNIVPRFEVQLANTYNREKSYDKIKSWVWSYKLDGLRCIALRSSSDEYYDKGKWTLYSRKGKEFLTVEHLKAELEVMYQSTGHTFFDGELYKHGLSFEEIQGPVMAFTKGQVEDMEYHMFIGGDANDFLKGKGRKNYKVLGGECEDVTPHLYCVNKGVIEKDEIEDKLEEAFAAGYEGIMLRDLSIPYDYKRSDAILKLKQGLNDDGEIITDCVVDSIEYDDFPVIIDGVMVTEHLLVRLWVIQPDGIKCKVGSGFDLEFRRYYTEHPDELIEKIVEIKHQMWGAQGRMRFPRLYRVRLDL
jgi:ATP-dependent DNA ligase